MERQIDSAIPFRRTPCAKTANGTGERFPDLAASRTSDLV
jgi:hypothetical protein